MPIKFKLDPSKNLGTFIANGSLLFDEVQEAIQQFYTNTNPLPSRNILWDLRNASVNEIRSDEAGQLAQLAVRIDKRKEIGKTAIVASSDLVYGVSKIFEAYTGNPDIKFQVFRDMEDALEWIELERE
jgi:hypothetical protein